MASLFGSSVTLCLFAAINFMSGTYTFWFANPLRKWGWALGVVMTGQMCGV